jgi:hypothetical protein
MNSNKDWTDKLPELFEGYTEAEPDGLWDAVRTGIEPKNKRPLAALWYAGSLLAAAAVAALALLLWPVSPSAESAVSLVPGDAIVADNVAIESVVPAGEVLPSSACLSETPPGKAGPLPLQPREAMAPDWDTSQAERAEGISSR